MPTVQAPTLHLVCTPEEGDPSVPSAGAASRQPGSNEVTATTHSLVTSSAGCYSGTLTTQMSGTRTLPVGKLHAVVVRR